MEPGPEGLVLLLPVGAAGLHCVRSGACLSLYLLRLWLDIGPLLLEFFQLSPHLFPLVLILHAPSPVLITPFLQLFSPLLSGGQLGSILFGLGSFSLHVLRHLLLEHLETFIVRFIKLETLIEIG